jgi:hypothetical protein
MHSVAEPPVIAGMQGQVDDVVLHVLGLLDATSLGRCAAVSRNLRRLATARHLWVRLLQLHAATRGWAVTERQLQGVSRAGVVAALSGSGNAITTAMSPPSPARAPAPAVEQASCLLSVDPRVRRMYRISGPSVQFIGPLLGMDRAVRCEVPLPSEPHTWLRAVAGTAAVPSGCGSCAAASSNPVPHHFIVDRTVVGYFEVTIGPGSDTAGDGRRHCIAVGMGSARFPLHGKQPGWDACSYGYHSDDGHAFHGHGASGRPFGHTYGSGDVIGCGMSLVSKRVFFSKNGMYLGAPFVAKVNLMPLHPLVGLDSPAPIHFNLGDWPFHLDLDSLPASLHLPAAAPAAARAHRDSFGAAFRLALACVVPKFGTADHTAGASAIVS